MSSLDAIDHFKKFFTRFLPQPVANSRNSRLGWFLMGTLVLVKLWLVSGQPLFALADNSHDDLLFVRLANYLAQLQWLGPYDNLILAKGPFYPLWIALAFLAGVPLLLSQHLLYIAACLVTERALQPLIGSRWWRMAIFVLLLFNPVTVTWQLTRVLRDDLYVGLTLLIVGSAIGLLARRREPGQNLVGWAITCGLATAAFWLTREEGVWILPFLVPLLIWALAAVVFSDRRNWRKMVVIALTAALPILAIQAVSIMNWTHYGIYASVEFKTPEFKAAYGALTRVLPVEHKSQVPVLKETRLRIYQQSAAFAELQPFFERDKFWTFSAVGLDNHPSGSSEIGGGWFMWALRDAVAAAGYFKSGVQAASFFQRLADEVNAACQEQRLDCLAERASLIPPWRSEYLAPVIEKIMFGFGMLATFSGLSIDPPVPSNGSRANLLLFHDLTGKQAFSRGTTAQGEVVSTDGILPRQTRLAELKRSLLEKIIAAYQLTMPCFTILTLAAIGIWLFLAIKYQWFSALALVAISITAALSMRLLMLAVIDVTSFHAVHITYMSPLYSLWLLCCCLFTITAKQCLDERAKSAMRQVSSV